MRMVVVTVALGDRPLAEATVMDTLDDALEALKADGSVDSWWHRGYSSAEGWDVT